MARFDLRDVFRARTPQERFDALHLRPDLARAAVALVADQRIDVQVTRMELLLEPDETVLMLVEGRHAGQLGLLMLSTRRVVFRSHRETSASPPAFALEDLSDAQAWTGRMTGRIVLRFADAVLEVDKLLGKLADHFVTAVQAQRSAADRPAPGDERVDPLQQLVDLRARYDAGDISTADYESGKARLIQEL